MRILTIAPGPRFSTYDTFRYYTGAFSELGHHVTTFNYHDHYAYHSTALSYIRGDDPEDVGMQRTAMLYSSQDLISIIARRQPDLVFVVSGLALPPALWDWFDDFREALKKRFTVFTLLTESPYVDEIQASVVKRTDMAATTDIASLGALKNLNENVSYIRHAYHPGVHRLMPMSQEHAADVFMVGTGFPERVNILAKVNWSDIDLRIFGGNWLDTNASDPIKEYVRLEFLDNEGEVASYYSNSRISLNIYRTAKWPGENVIHIDPASAYSISPRCYEVMGCGGFLLTDARQEMFELFSEGDDFVLFDGSEDLQDKVRYYLAHPRQRDKIAMSGHMAVQDHTYMNRAAEIIDKVETFWRVL